MPVSYRQQLPLDPLEILQRANGFGRSLIGVRAGGALLERVGTLNPAIEEDGAAVSRNDAAETRLDIAAVASIASDRSETPHDTILPYVEFLDADGETILKITGLEGIERFDAALAGIERSALPYLAPVERLPVPVTPEDIAAVPLARVKASGGTVTLTATRLGIRQSWTGQVVKLSFGHNYINVIQPEVHLHVRGRAISAWTEAREGGAVTLTAIGENGEPLGLTLATTAAALQPVAAAGTA